MNKDAADAIREVCAGITRQIDRAYLADCGRKREAPTKLFNLMAEAGLLAVGIPEEYGGSGGGVAEVALALDLLGQAGLIAPRVVTSQMARTTIARHGNTAQKQRYLPAAASGKEFFAFAVTEADAGTNSFKIRTQATRQTNGDYVIRGEKAYITAVHEADHLLLVARTAKFDPDARKSGMSVFIVDPKAKGVTITPMDIGMYFPDKSSIVNFDDVVVPSENLLGSEGKGLESVFDCLNPERLMAAAFNVGLTDFLLNKAAAYARERAPFGAPIGSYQSVQHPMAAAKARVEATRALTHLAAEKYDSGADAGLESGMVKFLAADVIKAAADIAMTTFGGASMDLTQDLIPLYLFAKFQEIAPVNNNVVLSSIAEKALGLPRSY